MLYLILYILGEKAAFAPVVQVTGATLISSEEVALSEIVHLSV